MDPQNTPESNKSNLKNPSSYWSKNLRIMSILLSIWFFFSLGCGVLWVEYFNQFTLPGTGFKLGFWFAQQGSIIVFVGIVFVYAILMNRIDKEANK